MFVWVVVEVFVFVGIVGRWRNVVVVVVGDVGVVEVRGWVRI